AVPPLDPEYPSITQPHKEDPAIMSTRTPVVRLSRRNAVVAAVTAVVAAGAVAGCGSSGGSSSSGSTTANANASASLSAAQEALDQGAARPTDITVSTPITKSIPTGKKLVFISCGAASCQLQGNIVKE